jgi:hypothetical protein
VKLTGADGRAETRMLATRDARFVPRGTMRTEEYVAGAPRVIAIELK